jgi:hypothetical protein
MDNIVPIPVLIVAALADIPYSNVVKMAEKLEEELADESVFLTHLNDPRGALSVPAARSIIVSSQFIRMAETIPADEDDQLEEAEES